MQQSVKSVIISQILKSDAYRSDKQVDKLTSALRAYMQGRQVSQKQVDMLLSISVLCYVGGETQLSNGIII